MIVTTVIMKMAYLYTIIYLIVECKVVTIFCYHW
jgi:hypothetical protein